MKKHYGAVMEKCYIDTVIKPAVIVIVLCFSVGLGISWLVSIINRCG